MEGQIATLRSLGAPTHQRLRPELDGMTNPAFFNGSIRQNFELQWVVVVNLDLRLRLSSQVVDGLSVTSPYRGS